MVLDCPPVRTAFNASHRAAPERDVAADSSDRRDRSAKVVSLCAEGGDERDALEKCSASSSLMLLRFALLRTLSCWTRSTRGLGSTSLAGPMLLRLARLLGFWGVVSEPRRAYEKISLRLSFAMLGVAVIE